MSTEAFEQLRPTAWALTNGVQLHTVREGQGTPLIFIHGAMGDWRSWGAQWAAFTPHFDCISYSRRYSFPNHNPMPSPDHGALHEAHPAPHLRVDGHAGGILAEPCGSPRREPAADGHAAEAPGGRSVERRGARVDRGDVDGVRRNARRERGQQGTSGNAE